MTPEQFAYWLQGFTELTAGQQPSPEQWKSITEHLKTVFVKVTPEIQPFKLRIGSNEPDLKEAIHKMVRDGTNRFPRAPDDGSKDHLRAFRVGPFDHGTYIGSPGFTC